MCGKSHEQVLEETAAEKLQFTAEPGEKTLDCHMKRQAFLAGIQSGVVASIRRGVSQAAACVGVKYRVNNGDTAAELQRFFLPLFHY